MSKREAVDLMALKFLRDNGPDEIGFIETEEQFAAALLYLDLKKQGLVESRNPKKGVVYWNISNAGLRKLEQANA